jgi:hypothetical protein
MMMDVDERGGDPAAEWACERLVRLFAVLNDAREYERLAGLFTEDGVFARPTAPDVPIAGRAAILAFFRSRPPRLTRHIVANTLISVETPERARGVSYVVLYSAAEGASPAKVDAPLLVGAYDDTFVRTAAGWRFARRLGSVALST